MKKRKTAETIVLWPMPDPKILSRRKGMNLTELAETAEKEICRINKKFDFFSVFSARSARDIVLVAALPRRITIVQTL
jgi:hypothetical protein